MRSVCSGSGRWLASFATAMTLTVGCAADAPAGGSMQDSATVSNSPTSSIGVTTTDAALTRVTTDIATAPVEPPTSSAAPSTTSPATTVTNTITITITSSSTTTTTTTATTTTTTTTPTATTATTMAGTAPAAEAAVVDAAMPATNAAFERLARDNAVASISVRRDGELLSARASGSLIDGSPATPDSPMLVASVSKIVTAIGIARLVNDGRVAVSDPVPWAALGVAPHPSWADVTVRELLDHTSGMPVARTSWFAGGGDCASHLPNLVAAPPQSHRGTWRYSNGNYCALGLLIERVTGLPLDAALQILVFDPIGVGGLHLSTDGLRPTDAPHGPDERRFSRLGGAGTFVVSANALTAMTAALTPTDLDTLRAPGLFTDQYGWGHTGTISGAVSCLWVLDQGRTTVAATIAGSAPATGGDICDRVVPAVADDLGIGQGRPVRTP